MPEPDTYRRQYVSRELEEIGYVRINNRSVANCVRNAGVTAILPRILGTLAPAFIFFLWGRGTLTFSASHPSYVTTAPTTH